jgi:hypothetical protein
MCGRGPGGGTLAAVAIAAAALLPVSLFGPAALAQSSHTLLAKTMLRALSYDTRLRERAGEQMVVAVIHRTGNAASERESKEVSTVFRELEAVTLHGLPLRVASFSFDDPHELEVDAKDMGVDVFFVCQGMEADLPRLKVIAHRQKIRTVAAHEALAQLGVSLAVALRDRDKPLIVVNLRESREEGAAFASALLRLAKVLK